ncbi:MAG: hypothetical protein ACREH6_06040 [Geminicoccaceae bacterium]
MAIADEVAKVFFSARIARIDFRLGPLEVSPKRLHAVGKAIGGGRIKVAVASTGRLLSAAYSPHSNQMTLPSDQIGSVMIQASILHEGVHALVDLFRCTNLTVLDDEAAAYLAEAIYLRAAHTWVSGDGAALAIYKAADALAKAHDLYNTRAVRLSSRDAAALRSAIHAHPAYSGIDVHQRTSGHGVP